MPLESDRQQAARERRERLRSQGIHNAMLACDVLDSLATLSERQHFGGIVPVRALVDHVIKTSFCTRELVERTIVELHKAFALDLKVSNDPRTPDPLAVDGRPHHYAVMR